MTYAELAEKSPEFRRQREAVQKLLGPLIQQHLGSNYLFLADESEVSPDGLCHLHVLNVVQGLQIEKEARDDQQLNWTDLGLMSDGMIVRGFISDHGDVAQIPEDLVRAFTKGRVLDCHARQSSTDPGSINFQRGEEILASVPKSLVRQLVGARKKQSEGHTSRLTETSQ